MKNYLTNKTFLEKSRGEWFAYFLIVPALLVVLIINVYPLLNSIFLSFRFYNLTMPLATRWVGLLNHFRIFSMTFFQDSFYVTLLFSFFSVFCLFLLGIYFALLLNRQIWGIGILRGLLMIPWAVPTFVNAFLWLWMIDVQFGIINFGLRSLYIIDQFKNWLGDPYLAMLAVLLAYVWRVFPFNVVVYLAQLQSIDHSYYEAAEMDGAGWLKSFIKITLPMLKNTIVVTGLLNLIWAFQEFTTIWIITRGGPVNATNVLSVFIYRYAFESYDFGMASTAGVWWMAFLLIFSIISFKKLVKEDVY